MAVNDSVNTIVPLTPGTSGSPGRRFAVIASAAGNVEVILAGGQSYILPVVVGLQTFPLAVIRVVNGANTTATATYANWL